MERDAKLLTVRDVMSHPVRSLPASMGIGEALSLLRAWRYSGAPVITPGGYVVGVLSERDAMKVLASSAFYALPPGDVQSFMTKDVDFVSPEDDIFSVVQRVESSHHRRFPVVEDQKLIGIVTLHDLGEALWRLTQDRMKGHRKPDHPPGWAWDPNKLEG